VPQNETEIRRRWPLKDQLRIWRDYIETSEFLRSRLASRLQSDSGLSAGDYAVMLALSEAPGRRLRPSELAMLVGWNRSRLSHHLGRMENRGLIRRESCPEDSRGAFVCLTEGGFDAFRYSSRPHLEAVRELFVDAFTPEQLSQIDTLTATLRTHLGFELRG